MGTPRGDPIAPFGAIAANTWWLLPYATPRRVTLDWRNTVDQDAREDLDLLRYLTDGACNADNLVWRWSSLMVTLNLAGIAAAVAWLSNTPLPTQGRVLLFLFGLILNLVWCALIQDSRHVHHAWIRAAWETVEGNGAFPPAVRDAIRACSSEHNRVSSAIGFASRWMYPLAGLFGSAWGFVAILS